MAKVQTNAKVMMIADTENVQMQRTPHIVNLLKEMVPTIAKMIVTAADTDNVMEDYVSSFQARA